MSQHIGNHIPAPLRFELGVHPSDETARAVLVATVDKDGMPRVAVLSQIEVRAPDDRLLEIDVREGTSTCENLQVRNAVALWYVLDAAAYTVKGRARPSPTHSETRWRRFHIDVESVWRDFEPQAPMIAGPTYRLQRP